MNNSSRKFNQGLYKNLLRSIPPKKYSPYLADIVNILIDALEKGELEVDIDTNNIPFSKFSCQGWPQKHLEALQVSGWLEGDVAPIVIRENKLSWRRWDENMQKVINELIKRSEIKKEPFSSEMTKPIEPKNLNEEQKAAVEAINSHNIILISGGPGTGKTSTLKSILERALSSNSKLRVGLAAPTGKATRRLKDSIQDEIEIISTDKNNFLSNVPCQTLHSWLKATPKGFGKNKKNLISLDILIIDEMSMVDLELMQGLLNAYPKTSQLILVGDSEQLPPIRSGAIWHQLQKEKIQEKFGGGSIHLQKVYRNKGEIASLSLALRQRSLSVFWGMLNQIPKGSNFIRYSYKTHEIPNIVISLIEQQQTKLIELTNLLKIQAAEELLTRQIHMEQFHLNAQRLLSQIDSLLVLCPKRKGSWGVNHIHKKILQSNLEKGVESWPQGTPVMCGVNQPEIGLSNGDIGILIEESKQKKIIFRVLSKEGNLSYQLIHTARIKKIEPALALTIHKAQGSEAKKVILLWPNLPNEPFISAEESSKRKSHEKRLLYTAITRAKEQILLISR